MVKSCVAPFPRTKEKGRDFRRRWIVLSVADDGAPVTGEIVPGTGLRSIAERCARLGGEMRVEADQGGRFTLTCRVPG